jgi:hypothetical protein
MANKKNNRKKPASRKPATGTPARASPAPITDENVDPTLISLSTVSQTPRPPASSSIRSNSFQRAVSANPRAILSELPALSRNNNSNTPTNSSSLNPSGTHEQSVTPCSGATKQELKSESSSMEWSKLLACSYTCLRLTFRALSDITLGTYQWIGIDPLQTSMKV